MTMLEHASTAVGDALARLAQTVRGRHVPFLQQVTAADCGPACLAMVLAYHGKHCGLDRVRRQTGCGRDGTTAADLLRTARELGLIGRGVRVDLDALHCLSVGTILHWELNHFVVFVGCDGKRVRIVDPGFGPRTLTLAEVDRSFTGIALELSPSEHFRPERDARQPLRRYLRLLFADSGAWSRILVTSVVVQLASLALPILTHVLVDRVVPMKDVGLLTVLGLGLALMTAFHFAASWVRAQILLHVRSLVDVRTTMGFMEHLASLPLRFFQERSTGDLVLRLASNSVVREILTAGALSALLDGLLVVLYLLLLLAVDVRIALVVLAAAFVHGAVYLLARHRQRELMGRSLVAQARTSSYEVEMLGAMETLKSMGSETRAVEGWSHLFIDSLDVALGRGRLDALTSSARAAIGVAAPLVVLGYGATKVLAGQLSLGTMLGVSALAAGFLVPIAAMVGTALQVEQLGSYLERLDDVLSSEPEQPEGGQVPLHGVQGGITLEHVDFAYADGAPLVLRDIDVDIAPGRFVAVVGASGAGKSTLARLLVGLHRPTRGRVSFDGVDLEALDLRSLRRRIGVVPQDPKLFARSIRANIALADPDASLERITWAASVAGIHDEIAAMPMGYETVLADGGSSLSGGQRQRIALARALLAEPRILLLDEATSALDSVTERHVQDALAKLRCTRIAIAHRLSTIIAADRILVMDQGRLVESGTHEELLRHGGVYAKLVAAQLGSAGGPS